MMKLGLLVCDHVAPGFRYLAGDYSDMFARLLGPHVDGLEITPYDVCEGEFPSGVDSCDAFLCTGSRHSSFDDLDWIHDLKAFIRRLHASARPFVGICFGHQILADALGGEVARSGNGWGAGVHTIDILQDATWMQPASDEIRLAYMHRDQVIRLPDGAVRTGASEHCPIAVFRVGDSMLGIQAHPEFPPAYSEALIRDRMESLGMEKAKEAISSLEGPTDEGIVGRWMAAFLSVG